MIIGSGKTMTATLNMLYDYYVEMSAHKYFKYKRLPRKLKKSLSINIKNRIRELQNER